jgi:hypothetical protein
VTVLASGALPLRQKSVAKLLRNHAPLAIHESGAYWARTGNAETRLVLSTVFIHFCKLPPLADCHRGMLN